MSQGNVDPAPKPTPAPAMPPWAQLAMLILTAIAGVLAGPHIVPDGGGITPTPAPQPAPNPATFPQPTPNPQPPVPFVTPVPQPQPVPPVPVPVPIPTPSPQQVINISVSDVLGNQIHGSVNACQMFIVSVAPEFQLLGIPQPTLGSGEVIIASPNKLICTLQAGAKLQVVAYGGSGKPTIAMVTCNQAPQPPPVPPTPLPVPPTPDPVPPGPQPQPTPITKKVMVAVVEDSLNRSPETAHILNNFGIWEKIKSSGNDWRRYDGNPTNPDQDPKAQSALSALKNANIPLPGLVTTDLSSGSVISAQPLTQENVTALVKQLGI